MVQIGRINKLTVKRIRDYDVYLDGGELGDILLPLLELPENCQVNDEVEVFVYNESEGRLQATIQTPRVMVGQVAKLQVVTNATTGSYLNWGLKKDLFAPRSQQLVKMEEGQSYVIFVFLDKRSNRITASSKLDKLLSQEPPRYAEGEEVDLLIYDTTDLGYKAVVNKTHGGMLYKNEVFQKVVVGQSMKGFIKKIREDGKIDLILQQSGYQGVDDISQTILDTIRKTGGKIALTDKSPPEEIYSSFRVSKKVFKKAIGALYKRKIITIDSDGIRLTERKNL